MMGTSGMALNVVERVEWGRLECGISSGQGLQRQKDGRQEQQRRNPPQHYPELQQGRQEEARLLEQLGWSC